MKTGSTVIVTMVDKGKYTHLTNGSRRTFKVISASQYGFTLKKPGVEPLHHLYDWEKSPGLFYLAYGMIVRIERKPTILETIKYRLDKINTRYFTRTQ